MGVGNERRGTRGRHIPGQAPQLREQNTGKCMEMTVCDDGQVEMNDGQVELNDGDLGTNDKGTRGRHIPQRGTPHTFHGLRISLACPALPARVLANILTCSQAVRHS